MPFYRSLCLFLAITFMLICWRAPVTAAAGDHPLGGDALRPPPRRAIAPDDTRPTPDQISAFMAGRVAVQIIFVESDGAAEPSTEDWTPDQIATIEGHVATALDWWRARLPNARLSFDLTSVVVGTRYEPITHGLSTEGVWIGDALRRMGYDGASYFDQIYAADDALRRARHADWATTIFMINSANDPDGRFADGLFAYAYIGGPFLVLTSDTGLYGTSQMAPVAAHELGHTFGALDQYAAATTPCTQESGYLWAPTTNSQYNNCGSHFPSIMLDPVAAFAGGQVDDAALGQIGYRDSDGDLLPDPLDTAPALDLAIDQPNAGRPLVTGSADDQPYPSISTRPTTINTIARVEYRVDGGAWAVLPAQDGAYDNAGEQITATLPLYDGQYHIDLRAINSVGVASPLLSRNVMVKGIGAQPDYAVEAPQLSNSTAVTLTLAAPAGAAAQVSEDPLFTGAAWLPIQTIASWQLIPTDGQHTLYVRFRDGGGVESAPFAHAILLDRTAPSGAALLHADDRPWVELQAQDDGSGVAAMQISDDGEMDDWQPFQSSLLLRHSAQNIKVRFRDAAGNVSASVLARNASQLYLPLVARP